MFRGCKNIVVKKRRAIQILWAMIFVSGEADFNLKNPSLTCIGYADTMFKRVFYGLRHLSQGYRVEFSDGVMTSANFRL